ncbi:hypothetical protein SAMN03080610_02360 [Afifella marina DSM 2698]|uniref:Inner membrane protein n=1 Tax=Afifella marina DSM 2698 TaxID=1120955 RepID=A0A1G5NP41_AFIMA|nr:hypothetical protein SAMN03080610_02360 [Afifella marina DSM 2698]
MARQPEDKRMSASGDKRKPVTIDLKAEEVKQSSAGGPADPKKNEAPKMAVDREGRQEEPGKTGAPAGPVKPSEDKNAQREDAVKTGAASRGADSASATNASGTDAAAKGSAAAASSAATAKAGEKPSTSANTAEKATPDKTSATSDKTSDKEPARPDSRTTAPGAAGKNASSTSAAGTAGATATGTAATGTATGKPGAIPSTGTETGAASSADKDVNKGTPKPGPEKSASGKTPPPPKPPKRGVGFGGLLLAGIVGGGVALGGAWALQTYGPQYGVTLPGTNGGGGTGATAGTGSNDAAIARLQDEQAQLQEQLEALQNQPAVAEGGGSDDLRAEVSELQRSVANLTDQNGAASAEPTALNDLRNRINSLEEQMSAAAGGGESAPAQAGAGASQGELQALSGRLDDLSGRLGDLENAAPVDLGPLQQAVTTNQQMLTTLQQSVSGAAASSDLSNVRDSVADLQNALQHTQSTDEETRAQLEELSQRMTKLEESMENATAIAPAVAAEAFADAVASGQSYETELEAVFGFAGEGAVSETLSAHAAEGLPTREALAAEFRTYVPKILRAADAPEEDVGVMDRLIASARGLVEVRPAGPRQGDEPDAIVSRIEADLAAGRLNEAYTEWQSLPEGVRQPSADWAEKLKARADAEALAEDLRAKSLSRLNAAG